MFYTHTLIIQDGNELPPKEITSVFAEYDEFGNGILQWGECQYLHTSRQWIDIEGKPIVTVFHWFLKPPVSAQKKKEKREVNGTVWGSNGEYVFCSGECFDNARQLVKPSNLLGNGTLTFEE